MLVASNREGSTVSYKIDTKLMHNTVFKMCTKCGIFTHDFSDLYCDRCKDRLQYVDLSDVDAVKNWLEALSINDLPKNDLADLTESDLTGSDFDSDESDFDEYKHNCGDDGYDCIDCENKDWENSGDEYDCDCDSLG
jgi:hypothetical protein